MSIDKDSKCFSVHLKDTITETQISPRATPVSTRAVQATWSILVTMITEKASEQGGGGIIPALGFLLGAGAGAGIITIIIITIIIIVVVIAIISSSSTSTILSKRRWAQIQFQVWGCTSGAVNVFTVFTRMPGES